jgi:hypothetical protein
MLFYCAILFIFLIVAVILIIQLASALGDNIGSNIIGVVSVYDVEDNLTEAARSYVNKYYSSEDLVDYSITVTSDNLIKYNLLDEESLTPTKEKNPCVGYALVKKNDEDVDISSYIKCSSYETDGYQNWRLGD